MGQVTTRLIALPDVAELTALVVANRLGLHRIQGETLEHNIASQLVLECNGFERIGFAPQFLNIAGRWQDHVPYQRINDAWSETGRAKAHAPATPPATSPSAGGHGR